MHLAPAGGAGSPRRRVGLPALAAAALLLLTGVAPLRAQEKSPLDSISKLPGAAAERDTSSLLAPGRIARLPEGERAAWRAYLRRSHELHARDSAVMAAELRALGRDRMTQATYTHAFSVERWMKGAWFASDSARALAESLLSWQTPAGGWSKHVDMRLRARRPGESWYGENADWRYIGTLDNDATVTQLRILGGVANAVTESESSGVAAESSRRKPAESESGSSRKRTESDSGAARLDSDSDSERLFRAAFLRGLAYLHAAQYPNGCFPQVYPLQGGYHDAATFNDNAIVNALRLLRDVARGQYGFVPAPERELARADFARGLDCILRSQVLVAGVRTVWGQQHDPLTLAPAPARSYELEGLAGRESAWLLDFLMELPDPDPRVLAAVHAGAAWFRAHAVRDSVYGEDQVLRASPGAGPIWARNTEIATMRPIFANRDGIKLYDWNKLTDRRSGYGWFGTEPAATLRRYETWARRHPAAPVAEPRMTR